MRQPDSSMLYKIMILYMLRCSNIKLSTADISDFLVMAGYTDAFSLQYNLNELETEGFIETEKKHNRSYVSITPEGEKTVQSLESRLSKEIRRDIYNHIAINKSNIVASQSLEANVVEDEDGKFISTLSCKGRQGSDLYNISLSFPSRALAETACDNFRKNSTEIYKYMIEKLLD